MDYATPEKPVRSPVVVAIVSWLLPGAGYWLIGETKRSVAIGTTVILMFLAGLLIGGLRVLDVPGYNQYGMPIRVASPSHPSIMIVNPWQELKNKPWSMAQVLTGPISIIGGFGSVWASGPATPGGKPIADVSHTPVNEAGTLYTSVAGMLNLLAIIDATHRALKRDEEAA